MRKDILCHRERVRLALHHKTTDRIPIAMVCSGINPPAYEALTQYLGRERDISVEEYLKPLIDIKGVRPEYIGPKLEEGQDMWGVRRKPVSYGPASYSEIDYYPLREMKTVDEVLGHRWPTTEWFDYSVIPERIKEVNSEEEYCLIVSNGNIFESSWYMRGFEQLFLDMAVGSELVDVIMGKVADFYVEHFKKIFEQAGGKVDLGFTADDIGGQQGLLMSLQMWERYVKPHHERLSAVVHAFGAKVIYHSDGSVIDAVEGLIDMGVDVLQPVQCDAAGMDPVVLKERYGDRLCFEGAISVQKTLPFGTPEDVRREVLERIRVLGRDGGYILGPSHAIQAGTPPENIVALFDTAAAAKM